MAARKGNGDGEIKSHRVVYREPGHKFSDDGTVTYFWRAHTFTVLIVLVVVLVYVAVFEPLRENTSYNTKR
ncbi:Phosphatidylserine synthase 2 [Blattella germanica]|nr:Phosphatidylserine synthase 2 [Blattella germanica]